MVTNFISVFIKLIPKRVIVVLSAKMSLFNIRMWYSFYHCDCYCTWCYFCL